MYTVWSDFSGFPFGASYPKKDGNTMLKSQEGVRRWAPDPCVRRFPLTPRTEAFLTHPEALGRRGGAAARCQVFLQVLVAPLRLSGMLLCQVRFPCSLRGDGSPGSETTSGSLGTTPPGKFCSAHLF